MNDIVKMRVTAEQKRAMTEAARREGLELSAWLRSVAMHACGPFVATERPVVATPEAPRGPVVAPSPDVVATSRERAAQSPGVEIEVDDEVYAEIERRAAASGRTMMEEVDHVVFTSPPVPPMRRPTEVKGFTRAADLVPEGHHRAVLEAYERRRRENR